MNLSDHVRIFYLDQGNNCAVATLLGAGKYYDLGLSKEDAALLIGFGGGMGCGKVCGCLAGAIAVLGKLFSARPDFRALCGSFTREFEQTMGCNSIDCDRIKPLHRSPETKCWACVEKSALLLEDFIARSR